ncbi:mCG1026369, partial [Mus musculus]
CCTLTSERFVIFTAFVGFLHSMNSLRNSKTTFKGGCCPWRGSTQQLKQTDIDTYSETVDGAGGLLWKNKKKDWGP